MHDLEKDQGKHQHENEASNEVSCGLVEEKDPKQKWGSQKDESQGVDYDL